VASDIVSLRVKRQWSNETQGNPKHERTNLFGRVVLWALDSKVYLSVVLCGFHDIVPSYIASLNKGVFSLPKYHLKE
jgi:hypothetical protein